MKESDILASILDWLAAKRVLAFRMNTGAVMMDKRFVRFGTKGMADILAFPHMIDCDCAMPVWIEVKTRTGAQSLYQQSFQKQVERDGHGYLICRSIDDLERYMKLCFSI